jgi:hypothetical protein
LLPCLRHIPARLYRKEQTERGEERKERDESRVEEGKEEKRRGHSAVSGREEGDGARQTRKRLSFSTYLHIWKAYGA